MGLPYGGKADVYSWSLLAWSVFSAKQPFGEIGRSTFYERVVVSAFVYRPLSPPPAEHASFTKY